MYYRDHPKNWNKTWPNELKLLKMLQVCKLGNILSKRQPIKNTCFLQLNNMNLKHWLTVQPVGLLKVIRKLTLSITTVHMDPVSTISTFRVQLLIKVKIKL